LYQDLQELLPIKLHGWFNGENREVLSRIIFYKKIKKVLEVGSWLGLSTSFFASLIPEDGVVFAVDHFEGSLEHKADDNKEIPTLYQQFLSNMIHTKSYKKVKPIRAYSKDAAKIVNETFDLIYIDASHDEASVYEDLCLWEKKLASHAILCGDDYNWIDPETKRLSVKKAVMRFAKERGLILYAGRCFWMLSEKSDPFALDLGQAPCIDYIKELKDKIEKTPIQTALQVGEDAGFLACFVAEMLPTSARLFIAGPYSSPKRFELLLENIKARKLEEKITALKMPLSNALEHIKGQVDFIYYHKIWQQNPN
jgi:predicted O-methyltransferase YrrM